MRYMRWLAVALVTVALAAAAWEVGRAQGGSARAIVEDAAKALGGIDRIQAVKNITLHGYAQYAYQMGGAASLDRRTRRRSTWPPMT